MGGGSWILRLEPWSQQRSLKEGGREVKGRNRREMGTEKNRIMLPFVLDMRKGHRPRKVGGL